MPLITTYVTTPGLSFSAIVLPAGTTETLVVLTACLDEELVGTLVVFERKEDGFFPTVAHLAGRDEINRERLDNAIKLVQVGLAAMTSIENRIPMRRFTDVTKLGFEAPWRWYDEVDVEVPHAAGEGDPSMPCGAAHEAAGAGAAPPA